MERELSGDCDSLSLEASEASVGAAVEQGGEGRGERGDSGTVIGGLVGVASEGGTGIRRVGVHVAGELSSWPASFRERES